MRRLGTLHVLGLLAAGLAAGCDSSGTPEPAAPAPTDTGGVECSCGAAVCGIDNCGNTCGTCGDAGSTCWAGACESQAALACDDVGLVPAQEAAYTALAGGKLRLTYLATTDTPEATELANAYDEVLQKLKITFVQDKFFGDAEHKGTFPLSVLENTGDDCALCVTAYGLCNDSGCAPSSTYVPVSGEIEIFEDGAPGGRFTATIRQARFEQRWLDSATGKLKTIPNAKSWCIDQYPIDVEVPALSEAKGNCDPNGTGKNVGDNIKDFTVPNCLGDDVSLHSSCGLAKAVWLIASAEW